MSELARQLITKNLEEKNPYLDLGNCGLTDDNFPEEIIQLVDHLETLSLASVWYEYDSEKARWIEKRSKNKEESNRFDKMPEVLKDLRHLQSLNLRSTEIMNIPSLQGLKKLQSLDQS